ncbi:MAG TPA: HAD hydrolase-like protein, partial [Myxococcaceae bacterium]|nr:HAD hydrolase-like protein [Myxococcaceae bacterium]
MRRNLCPTWEFGTPPGDACPSSVSWRRCLDYFKGGGVLQTVIFDVDGTLVDSVDLHARSWQEAFSHFGKELPFDR